MSLQMLVQAGRSPASLWPSRSQLQRVQPQPRPLLPLLPITHWKTTQVTSSPSASTSISSSSFSPQLLECQLHPHSLTATLVPPSTHRLCHPTLWLFFRELNKLPHVWKHFSQILFLPLSHFPTTKPPQPPLAATPTSPTLAYCSSSLLPVLQTLALFCERHHVSAAAIWLTLWFWVTLWITFFHYVSV